MDKSKTFIGIMVFYILLSYLIFPLFFYYFIDKTYTQAGNGFMLGSVVSILLWRLYGSNMVK